MITILKHHTCQKCITIIFGQVFNINDINLKQNNAFHSTMATSPITMFNNAIIKTKMPLTPKTIKVSNKSFYNKFSKHCAIEVRLWPNFMVSNPTTKCATTIGIITKSGL